MKCENCGQELNEGDMFCTNCGSAVNNNVVDVNKELETSNAAVDNAGNINNVEVNDNISSNVDDNSSMNNIYTFNNSGEINNNASDNKETSDHKNKKKKSKGIIVILTVFVVVIGALIALYLLTRKSAKDIFVNGFKKATNEVFNSEYLKKKSSNQTIKFNISGSGLDDSADVYNKMVVNNKMSIDTSNSKLDEELSLSYDGSNILGMGIYARDNNIYLGFNDIYDRYVKLPVTEKMNIELFKGNNKVIKSAIDEAFIKSFDDKYFTKSKKKVDIDDKKVSVDAYTLTIDNNNIKDIMKSFIESLVNNKEFMSMLSKNYNIDINEIKNSINEIDYSELAIDSPITITIYTKGFNYSFVGIEFAVDNSASLKVLKKDNNNLVATLESGGIAIDATINKKESGNKSTITTSLNMMGLMNLSMIIDSIEQKNVEFKTIDNKDIIEYEDFIKNDINDVVNNISKNEKLIELISKLSSETGGDVNYSSLITTY